MVAQVMVAQVMVAQVMLAQVMVAQVMVAQVMLAQVMLAQVMLAQVQVQIPWMRFFFLPNFPCASSKVLSSFKKIFWNTKWLNTKLMFFIR